MNITLKNIKHIPRLSEETECFTASIYIDGVKKGEASNRGCGGNTDIHPRELAESIHDYAKTLPPLYLRWDPSLPYPQSGETIIEDLIYTHLRNKRKQK